MNRFDLFDFNKILILILGSTLIVPLFGSTVSFGTFIQNETFFIPNAYSSSGSSQENGNIESCIKISGKEICKPITLEQFEGLSQIQKLGQIPNAVKEGFADSRIVVIAKAYRDDIVMNNKGLSISTPTLFESTTNQIIQEIQWNEDYILIIFDRSGDFTFNVKSTVKPTKVFADNIEVPEFQGAFNTIDPKEIEKGTWAYHEVLRTIIVNVDSESITLSYKKIIPLYINIIAIIASLSVGIGLYYRKRRESPRPSGLG